MKAEISLKELVRLMIEQSNKHCYFFSLERMVFEESSINETSTDGMLTDEDLSALQTLRSPDVVPIPSKTEINEFAIMKQFAHQLYNTDITHEILSVMNGSGVFKRFNEIVAKRGIESEWSKFKIQSFKKHAIKWCQKNGFPYIDDLS